jgi:inner membrane protein
MGHVAVGLAGARLQDGRHLRLRSTIVLIVLATFPDLDLLSPLFGAGPQSVWVHRGASHSLTVALAAAVVGFQFLDRRRGGARTFLVALSAAASHPLLDMLTQGSAGVMLLWPLSRSRYLSPISLLPASPLGPWLFAPHGVTLAVEEALLFAPLVVYACWPRRLRAPRGLERVERPR